MFGNVINQKRKFHDQGLSWGDRGRSDAHTVKEEAMAAELMSEAESSCVVRKNKDEGRIRGNASRSRSKEKTDR